MVAHRDLITGIHALLVATAARPAHFGCFGMHEWAMVYRVAEDEPRHPAYPLRLGQDGTDGWSSRIGSPARISTLIGSSPSPPGRRNIPAARPRRPAGVRATGVSARRHGPLQARLPARAVIPSELSRTASRSPATSASSTCGRRPMTSVDLGFEPVRVETAEGKRVYAAAQAGFAERGAPLRQRLIVACERLLRRARARRPPASARPKPIDSVASGRRAPGRR